MKRFICCLSLLLANQIGLFACATCVSLAEKNPKKPKSEVYVQLKKKNSSAKTRRRKARRKKTCTTCKAKTSEKTGE